MPPRQQDVSWIKRIDRMLNDGRSTSKKRFDVFIALLVLFSTAIIFVGGFSTDECLDLFLACVRQVQVSILRKAARRNSKAQP